MEAALKSYDPSHGLDVSIENVARFIANCDSHKTLQPLLKSSAIMLQKMNFDWFTFRYIPLVGAHYHKSAREYTPRFRENLHKKYETYLKTNTDEIGFNTHTPIERFVLESGHSFWLGDLNKHSKFQSLKMQEYLDMLRLDLGQALFVPAYGIASTKAVFCFVCSEAIFRPCEISIGRLEYIAFHFLRRVNAFGREHITSLTSKLSPRERDVLNLLPHGMSNKQIAIKLGISPNTVDGYMKNIFLKLDVPDRMTASLRWVTSNIA